VEKVWDSVSNKPFNFREYATESNKARRTNFQATLKLVQPKQAAEVY